MAVLGTLAPATTLAAVVARRTLSLRQREVVHVQELRSRTRDDLVPIDRLHVAQVVVVQHRDSTL